MAMNPSDGLGFWMRKSRGGGAIYRALRRWRHGEVDSKVGTAAANKWVPRVNGSGVGWASERTGLPDTADAR